MTLGPPYATRAKAISEQLDRINAKLEKLELLLERTPGAARRGPGTLADDVSIALLAVSTRTFNALSAAGLETVGDVRASLLAGELPGLPRMGATTVGEVCAACAALHPAVN